MGIRANILYYTPEQMVMSVFLFLPFHQSRRLHELGNISVSIRSAEQTEPADARRRDAGRGIRATLLSATSPFWALYFFFFFF